MSLLLQIKESLLHLAFPHLCAGCGSDTLDRQNHLCPLCLSSLPQTHFSQRSGNPVEKIFYGRLPLAQASAQYYFTAGSRIQRLMHGLKYRGNAELGHYLGRLMGSELQRSGRFDKAKVLLPLPLYPERERKRGYNQAALLCRGMAEEMGAVVRTDAVIRKTATESQTKKSRVERWQNMEGGFVLRNTEGLEGKELLLVDDVVTTGATLEACGRALLGVPGVRLSIATLCFSAT